MFHLHIIRKQITNKLTKHPIIIFIITLVPNICPYPEVFPILWLVSYHFCLVFNALPLEWHVLAPSSKPASALPTSFT